MDPKPLTKLAISLIGHTLEFNHLKPTILSLPILSQAFPHKYLDQDRINESRMTHSYHLGEMNCSAASVSWSPRWKEVQNWSNKAARGRRGPLQAGESPQPIILVSQAQECSNLYKYIPKPQPPAHTSHSNHNTHRAQPSSHPVHHFHLFFHKNKHNQSLLMEIT